MSTIVRETQTPAVTERERRARTLEAAALEIEVRGWVQGCAVESETGKVCALGAAVYALGQSFEFYNRGELYGQVARLWGGDLAKHITHGPPHYAISEFNDAADSVDEVTFLLRWRAEEIRDGR